MPDKIKLKKKKPESSSETVDIVGNVTTLPRLDTNTKVYPEEPLSEKSRARRTIKGINNRTSIQKANEIDIDPLVGGLKYGWESSKVEMKNKAIEDMEKNSKNNFLSLTPSQQNELLSRRDKYHNSPQFKMVQEEAKRRGFNIPSAEDTDAYTAYLEMLYKSDPEKYKKDFYGIDPITLSVKLSPRFRKQFLEENSNASKK